MPDAFILDGKELAKLERRQVKKETAERVKQGAQPPGLGVILVGENPASQVYVASKERVAKRLGFKTEQITLPATALFDEVAAQIDSLNCSADIHGILLQLPLPEQLSANTLIDRLAPEKDVDGLHPVSQGLLLRGEGELVPCTPLGCMRLIDLAMVGSFPQRADDIAAADLSGKNAVVVGRSLLVGKPISLLLQARNATVTMAHSRTADLAGVVSQADIVVAAVGVPELVQGDWIKPGAVVIDVGINRTSDGALIGDVEYESAAKRASAITPVPGGVGPMTIAMLMANTLKAAQRRG